MKRWQRRRLERRLRAIRANPVEVTYERLVYDLPEDFPEGVCRRLEAEARENYPAHRVTREGYRMTVERNAGVAGLKDKQPNMEVRDGGADDVRSSPEG